MSGWNKIRDLLETAAVLYGNYQLPGSSLLTSHLASKGSQKQLGSTIGQLAQLGSGGIGAGIGSSVTGIPGSNGWSNLINGASDLIDGTSSGSSIIPGNPGSGIDFGSGIQKPTLTSGLDGIGSSTNNLPGTSSAIGSGGIGGVGSGVDWGSGITKPALTSGLDGMGSGASNLTDTAASTPSMWDKVTGTAKDLGLTKSMIIPGIAGLTSFLTTPDNSGAPTAIAPYVMSDVKPLQRNPQAVDPNSYFTNTGNRNFYDNNALPTTIKSYADGGDVAAVKTRNGGVGIAPRGGIALYNSKGIALQPGQQGEGRGSALYYDAQGHPVSTGAFPNGMPGSAGPIRQPQAAQPIQHNPADFLQWFNPDSVLGPAPTPIANNFTARSPESMFQDMSNVQAKAKGGQIVKSFAMGGSADSKAGLAKLAQAARDIKFNGSSSFDNIPLQSNNFVTRSPESMFQDISQPQAKAKGGNISSESEQTFTFGKKTKNKQPIGETVKTNPRGIGSLISGAGNGTSDNVPAMLSDGEFVHPAAVVSALGNGSNSAGAKKLYTLNKAILDNYYKGGKAPKISHLSKALSKA